MVPPPLPAIPKAADDAVAGLSKAVPSTSQADSTVVRDINWISDNVLAKAHEACEGYEDKEATVEVTLDAVKEPMTSAMDAMANSNNEALKVIADNVSSWAERSEALMKALDGVAQIHPFIGVAVIAFKTAVQLELQRGDNDRKVGALRVQRNDMMAVLCNLQHVSDAAAVKNDTRLADLIQRSANDIKECTQACDKYIQKKLVVKILKSNSWATKLSAFGTGFTNRKSEFQFALSIYTSKGVEQANQAIGDVLGMVDATQSKIDMLLLFKMLESPTERAMLQQVEAKGGASKVIGNDALLKEILDGFPSALSTSTSCSSTSGDDAAALTGHSQLQGLKKELGESIDGMLQKERAVFEAKFEVQMKQITELGAQVTRESDRVISTLLAGPGDRIKDKSLHEMWKEMGWKTSARTGRFVLVLRDYYVEKYDAPRLDERITTPGSEKDDREYVEIITGAGALPAGDKWALSYIGFTWLQPISEAFDDDGSGFVTVQELNKFTSSRPIGWSLLHWVAFWAVGWHLSLECYARKLNYQIFPAMVKLAEKVLPSNRGKVDRYLCSVSFRSMNRIAISLKECKDSDHFLERFQSYIDDEEHRLEGNFKPLKYEIDALITLALVTGPGRFERFLFPLMYLVLGHHCRLIELCVRKIVPEEFLAASRTLTNWNIGPERVGTMRVCKGRSVFIFADHSPHHVHVRPTSSAVYEQQHIDPSVQLARTPPGMFHYAVNLGPVYAAEMEDEYPELETDEDPVSRLEIPDLKNPMTQWDTDELDFDVYRLPSVDSGDEESDGAPRADSALARFVGTWDGLYYEDAEDPDGEGEPEYASGRVTIVLHIGSDGVLFGSGTDHYKPFAILPIESQDVQGNVIIRTKFLDEEEGMDQIKVKLDDESALAERWKTSESDVDEDIGRIVLERRPTAAIYRPRPHPDEFAQNRGQALWSIARTAILQHLWSWTHFKERRDARKRFVEFYQQGTLSDQWWGLLYIGPLSDDEEEGL